MRKIIVLLLFFISLVNGLFCQNRSIKSVSFDYGYSIKSPLMFLKGDTVVLDCDTAYLVNKGRYNFYLKMHNTFLSKDDSICNKLLNVYEQMLKENQDAYDKLLNNSKESEKISLDMINYSRNTLANTQKTLDYSQKALAQSMKNLELANDYIKNEKWNSMLRKTLFGVGGIGIGLIVGILVMK
jgi:ElaB/YqjD/DUF883 family membrane-anchored ribosome-binding protein